MVHHPERHIIIGIHVVNRTTKVPDIQQVLTEYGCYIKTRIGLHEASADFCSPNGVILVEMLDNEEKRSAMVEQLSKIDGIQVKEMIFGH